MANINKNELCNLIYKYYKENGKYLKEALAKYEKRYNEAVALLEENNKH